MPCTQRSLMTLPLAAAALALVASTSSPPAAAFPDEPRPRVDCSLKKNKKLAACKPSMNGNPSDAELYNAAYWQAKTGNYREALSLLARANQNDPRVLSYTGFATRKLGDVDKAMTFYDKALAINPDYTVARAYMGEAFLAKGDTAAARAQLDEIARRCGTACAEYADLAGHINAHEAGTTKGG